MQQPKIAAGYLLGSCVEDRELSGPKPVCIGQRHHYADAIRARPTVFVYVLLMDRGVRDGVR